MNDCEQYTMAMKSIKNYFSSEISSSDEVNSIANDESSESSVFPAEISCGDRASTHEVTATNSSEVSRKDCSFLDEGNASPTAKKRLQSSSPSDESRVMSKTARIGDILSSPSPADSFADLLNSEGSLEENTPRYIPLLFSTLEAMFKEMKSVSAKADSFCNFQVEVTKKVSGLESKVESLYQKFGEMENEMQTLRAENCKLKEANSGLNDTVGVLIKQVDRNEQHSRAECLLLHGVPEKKGQVPENSKLVFASEITSKVGVKMSERDIKQAHRYGPVRADGKPRPIIARFLDSSLRNSVYGKKKLLKGKNIFITENLTKLRMELLKKANDDYGRENVWTKEGRIMARDSNKQVITIMS